MKKWALVALLGCSGPKDDAEAVDTEETDEVTEPTETTPTGDPELVIGEGLLEYVAVEEGGELTLEYGPQGGIHVSIGLLVSNFDTEGQFDSTLEATVGEVAFATAAPFVQFRPSDEHPGDIACCYQLVWQAPGDTGTGLEGFLTPADAGLVDGATATITAQVTDAAGTSLSVSTDFVIHDPN